MVVVDVEVGVFKLEKSVNVFVLAFNCREIVVERSVCVSRIQPENLRNENMVEK